MKCTYRDEYFYRSEEVSKCIIVIVIWLAFAVGAYIVSPPLIIVFVALAVINVLLAYKYAKNRYKKAMEYRHKLMTQGYRCMGKIVDAGGRKVNVREIYYDNDSKKREARYTKLPNYWVEVEYLDSRDSQVKRYKSEEFGKKTRKLIGQNAEVYVYGDMIYVNIL